MERKIDLFLGFISINLVKSLLLLSPIFVAGLPEVISVRPDPDFNSVEKDYSASNVQTGDLLNPKNGSTLLFPSGNTKHWLVRMDNPYIGVVSKAQMVDYYVQMLAKVFGK